MSLIRYLILLVQEDKVMEIAMQKPHTANIPGMTDTLDFVKNLWGSMNIPGANMSGMSAPPLSPEDLDKRIADLKAVETWLNMNLTMLRGTIQTMEVQRATLATLKSMGASMAEVMRQSGVSAEKMASTPFGSFFGQPAAPPAAGAAPKAGAGAAVPDPAAAGLPAAMAWWNTLQEQFTQAVATAMTPAEGAAKPEPQAAAPAEPAQQPPAPGNGKDRGSKPKADNK
jgi:hypothetical protein